MWTSDLRVNETTPQQAPEKYFLGVHEQVFMRRISAASQSRWSARGDGIAIPLARRPPLPLRRRAVNSAPSSSLVRPATSCARNVSSYPRSSSNSYHAANAERTETIARSRGGIGRASARKLASTVSATAKRERCRRDSTNDPCMFLAVMARFAMLLRTSRTARTVRSRTTEVFLFNSFGPGHSSSSAAISSSPCVIA